MPSLITAALLLATMSHGTLASQAAAPAADQKAHAAAILASMAARDFAAIEAQFDDKMKAALPEGRLATIWNGLLAQVGAVKACNSGGARTVAIDDKHMVITPCEFERATIDLQLAFDPAGRISGFTMRPAAPPPVAYALPPYADASAYTETDVTTGAPGWPLPGTLTLPNGPGPFPAVVLVHGSGPADRDETVGANKPFKDLAVGLASRGIAVLRYEKRSRAHGPQMAALASMTVKDEVVDDALAAAALLRASPKIDPARVFVLGHSLGGMLVPRIAAGDPNLAGAIVMAGAARPLEQAIVEQTKYLAGADGTVTADEQKQIDDAAKVAGEVRALEGGAGGTGRRDVSLVPGAESPVRTGSRQEPARGVRSTVARGRTGRRRHCGVDQTLTRGVSDLCSNCVPL